jgi:HD-GYP domain-containing protein (c-di-GMP phosphodiesterase class II)
MQFCIAPLSQPGDLDDHQGMLLAERLVGEARERRQRRMESREQLVVGVSAVLFVAVGCALALTTPPNRSLNWLLMLGLVAGYALFSRVRFEFASEYVAAEQLMFIPMLLLLPVGLVPLLTATAGVLAILPDLATGTWDRRRWVTAIGEAWFSVGPVLVIAVLASGDPAVHLIPYYVLAFLAELLGDSGYWWLRYKLLEPIPFGEFVKISLSTTEVDAVLTAVAVPITVVAFDEPLVLLATGALVWLLRVFSRDRVERYSATLELSRAYRGTVMLLADVVEHEDGYTANHCRSVVELVQAVAEEMGVNPNARQELEFAALLHDVGKISIPKEILNKPASLDADEWELMKTHTIEGQFMLDRVGGLLGRVGEIVRSCHERWDGKGYPDALAAEEIPLQSRIVFVCDAWNAMTTDRSYRPAMSREDAMRELVGNAGTQFDPTVVTALANVIEQGEPEARSVDEMRALLGGLSVPQRVGATT